MPLFAPAGGTQSLPKVWAAPSSCKLRWDYTQQVIASGSGNNNPLPGVNFTSTGSDTLALTKSGGGNGNAIFPSTVMAGNSGYYLGVASCNGWQGGASGGHTLPAGSSMTLISLFRHMQQPSAGFPGVYVEKCYYSNDANSSPYVSLGLHFQPAGTHNWTAYITIGGSLFALSVPFSYNMLGTPSTGDLQRGDVIMLYSKYTYSTGIFEAGINGVKFAVATPSGPNTNIDWGTDGDWCVGSSLPRNNQASVPWDENLLVEFHNTALSDATLRQYWEVAKFGASL